MPAALHACRPGAWDPRLAAAPPTVLGGWGQGPQRKGGPSGIAEGVSRGGRGGGCWGDLEVRFWGVRSRITVDNRGVGSSLFLFPLFLSSLPASVPSPPPDTVPVLGPGHQPNYPAPWASGQSVPGAWPAGLPASPTPVSGQTRKADILSQRMWAVGVGWGWRWRWGPLSTDSAACYPHHDGIRAGPVFPGLLGSTRKGVQSHGNPRRLPGGGSAS